jgi:hypothetical protein
MAEHVTLRHKPRGCGQRIGWAGERNKEVRDGEIGVVCNVALIHEHRSSSMIIADCSVIHGLQLDELCTVMHSYENGDNGINRYSLCELHCHLATKIGCSESSFSSSISNKMLITKCFPHYFLLTIMLFVTSIAWKYYPPNIRHTRTWHVADFHENKIMS